MNDKAFQNRCFSGAILRVVLRIGCAALLTLFTLFQPAETSYAADQASSYSTRALELLQQMADSYAVLPILEQKTTFHSSMVPIKTEKTAAIGSDSTVYMPDSLLPRTMKLAFQAPNQIAVVMREKGDNDDAGMEKWISDGANFYSFQQSKNTYTKIKAPGRLRDFSKLSSMTSGSLELLMLMGINPFKDIRNLVQSVQIDDRDPKHSASNDCILLKMATPYEQTDLRLTLDSSTHLLLRLAMERTPISAAPAEKHPLGDALDELDTAAIPSLSDNSQSTSDSQQPKMKTLFSYDNTITTNPQFNLATFTFVIPKNALLYEPFDPSGKLQKKRFADQLANMLKERGFKNRPKIFK